MALSDYQKKEKMLSIIDGANLMDIIEISTSLLTSALLQIPKGEVRTAIEDFILEFIKKEGIIEDKVKAEPTVKVACDICGVLFDIPATRKDMGARICPKHFN